MKQTNKFTMRRTARLALGLALLSSAAVSLADDSFKIFGVPDHDQRRDGLPGDGSMYCVPTSVYNLINFMGTHGVPQIMKFPGDPNNVILNGNPYLGHTIRMEKLGQFMGTDAVDGTGGNGWTKGTVDYIDYVSNVPLIVLSLSSNANFPSPSQVLPWMRAGGLVSMAYGRYTNPYSFSKTRDGGHAISLVGVTFTTGSLIQSVDYRDPAADEGSNDPLRLLKQSPFATTTRTATAEYASYDGKAKTLYGLGAKPSDSTKEYAYIDGYRVLLPLCLLTNVLNSDNFHLNFSLAYDPAKQKYSTQSLGGVDIHGFNSPNADFVMDPFLPSMLKTMDGSRKIYRQGFFDDTAEEIAKAPTFPIGLEYGGPNMDLFVLQADRISMLHRDNQWGAMKKGTFPFEAQVYDPIRNRIVIGGDTNIQVMEGDTLHFVKKTYVRELGGTGRLFLRIDPKTGDLYAMRKGNPNMVRLKMAGDGSVRVFDVFNLPGAPTPDSFDFSRSGIFAAQNGHVMQFKVDGTSIRNSPFAGMPCGDNLKFSKNFNNWTADEYPLPAWRDLPEPQQPLR
ncbi:hypothetical protein BH11ARM1_BH11ARM1_13410 [soil metagenome]